MPWAIAMQNELANIEDDREAFTWACGCLGTSIIEALAKQLHARVQVADARPGTEVSIVHTTSLAWPIARAI
jgi:two-component sensor histidine kinase